MDCSVNITLENIIQRKIAYCQNDTDKERLSLNAGYLHGYNQMLQDMNLSETEFVAKYKNIIIKLFTTILSEDDDLTKDEDIDELSGYNNSIVEILSLLNEKYMYSLDEDF